MTSRRTVISWISKAGAAALLAVLALTGCGNGPSAAEEPTGTQPPMREVELEQPQAKAAREFRDILIAVDPGHQSWAVDMSAPEPNAPGSTVMKAKATNGTVGTYSGIYEYELNLDVSLRLRDVLEDRGFSVLLTREDNETAISNAERAVLANEAGADVLLRIHANGSEDPAAAGALALVPSSENVYVGALADESARLAETVLTSYCAATGIENRGLQNNDTMTGINWSERPVAILEMGFMTNEHDDMAMADDAFRQRMAEGIADGLEAYFESGQ